MSGEIKVLKISPTTGTDVTMGDSGDKFTFASGSEVILTGVTKTGFPAGGLTDATIWRQNTTTSAGTSDTFFTGNWEIPDNTDRGYATLGTAVGETSGVFYFK